MCVCVLILGKNNHIVYAEEQLVNNSQRDAPTLPDIRTQPLQLVNMVGQSKEIDQWINGIQ